LSSSSSKLDSESELTAGGLLPTVLGLRASSESESFLSSVTTRTGEDVKLESALVDDRLGDNRLGDDKLVDDKLVANESVAFNDEFEDEALVDGDSIAPTGVTTVPLIMLAIVSNKKIFIGIPSYLIFKTK